jgi:ATP-binding cassette subfamily C (CFTR/MRP) protein 1
MIPMSYLEHNKSLKPSMILNAYLLITLVFDAAILRTLWLSSFDLPIRALFTAQFTMKVIILILEGMEKRRYFKDEYAGRSPEEFSGLYGQSFLWWLNDIVLLGARQVLAPTDLYPVTANMSSKALDVSFSKIWHTCIAFRVLIEYAVADTSADKEMRRQPSQSKAQKHLLPKALIRLLWWQILTPIFSRISLIAFTFCQPLLLKRLLNYLGNSAERQNLKIGYGLIGAYGIVYLGMAVRPQDVFIQPALTWRLDLLCYLLASAI